MFQYIFCLKDLLYYLVDLLYYLVCTISILENYLHHMLHCIFFSFLKCEFDVPENIFETFYISALRMLKIPWSHHLFALRMCSRRQSMW